jgi:hypothetical protein
MGGILPVSECSFQPRDMRLLPAAFHAIQAGTPRGGSNGG